MIPRGIIRATPHGPDRPDDWRERSACLDEDPELFFLAGDGSTITEAKRAQIAEAKAVCARCPVKAECLEWAISIDAVGVFGGTTEDERRGSSDDPRCGTLAGYSRHRRLKEPKCGPCRKAITDQSRQRREDAARRKAKSA